MQGDRDDYAEVCQASASPVEQGSQQRSLLRCVNHLRRLDARVDINALRCHVQVPDNKHLCTTCLPSHRLLSLLRLTGR